VAGEAPRNGPGPAASAKGTRDSDGPVAENRGRVALKKDPAAEHPSYGYRRISVLLRRAGSPLNGKAGVLDPEGGGCCWVLVSTAPWTLMQPSRFFRIHPRLVTLIPVSVHPSTPQKICTTSRGSTSSHGGCPRQKNLSSIFGFLRLRNAYTPINPPPIRRSPIETRISQRGVKPRGGRTTFRT